MRASQCVHLHQGRAGQVQELMAEVSNTAFWLARHSPHDIYLIPGIGIWSGVDIVEEQAISNWRISERPQLL